MNLPRRVRLLPVLAVLLLAAGAAHAQTAARPAPSDWGRPASGAMPLPPIQAAPGNGAPRIPSAYAAARSGTAATGEYFHDFGELIVRVRSVKWIEEICSEAFPATAAANEHAYDDWLLDHGRFVDEMEGQFDVIDRYWADASPDLKKEGISGAALRNRVAAQKDALRDDFHATSATTMQRRCDAYPEILRSPQLDLEKSQAEYVKTVRAGPG